MNVRERRPVHYLTEEDLFMLIHDNHDVGRLFCKWVGDLVHKVALSEHKKLSKSSHAPTSSNRITDRNSQSHRAHQRPSESRNSDPETVCSTRKVTSVPNVSNKSHSRGQTRNATDCVQFSDTNNANSRNSMFPAGLQAQERVENHDPHSRRHSRHGARIAEGQEAPSAAIVEVGPITLPHANHAHSLKPRETHPPGPKRAWMNAPTQHVESEKQQQLEKPLSSTMPVNNPHVTPSSYPSAAKQVEEAGDQVDNDHFFVKPTRAEDVHREKVQRSGNNVDFVSEMSRPTADNEAKEIVEISAVTPTKANKVQWAPTTPVQNHSVRRNTVISQKRADFIQCDRQQHDSPVQPPEKPSVVSQSFPVQNPSPANGDTKRSGVVKPPFVEKRFRLADYVDVQSIVSDPKDRRLKAICDRFHCQLSIYAVRRGNGSKNFVLLIQAREEESLLKCVRSIDSALKWNLTGQVK